MSNNPTIGFESQFINTSGINAVAWNPVVGNDKLSSKYSNILTTNNSNQIGGLVGGFATTVTGVPQLSTVINNINPTISSTYSTLKLEQLKPFPGVIYSDFRARRITSSPGVIRLDGASSAIRGGSKIYPIASATPAGAYSIINLNGVGTLGYGWGDHDNITALRNDFTLRSHVATDWNEDMISFDPAGKVIYGGWKKTLNPIERINPFRGDRVTVIDFSKRTLQDVYKWNNHSIPALGAKTDLTKDFIKFFFTGPKLNINNTTDIDDIIVFRAIINSISDTFSPTWTPQTMIGRADPNYHYTGYSRDLSLDFTVYATDRDEVKPIWRKLNALAGYTAPEYDNTSIAFKAPWMRITIGDLFHQQPVIINSLSYTLHDSDTTWEINIEQDPTMKQVPHKISVSLGLTVISDHLPQKGGKFYGLSNWHKHDSNSMPLPGRDNWLSDSLSNPESVNIPSKYLPTANNINTKTSTINNNTLSSGGSNNNNNFG